MRNTGHQNAVSTIGRIGNENRGPIQKKDVIDKNRFHHADQNTKELVSTMSTIKPAGNTNNNQTQNLMINIKEEAKQNSSQVNKKTMYTKSADRRDNK